MSIPLQVRSALREYFAAIEAKTPRKQLEAHHLRLMQLMCKLKPDRATSNDVRGFASLAFNALYELAPMGHERNPEHNDFNDLLPSLRHELDVIETRLMDMHNELDPIIKDGIQLRKGRSTGGKNTAKPRKKDKAARTVEITDAIKKMPKNWMAKKKLIELKKQFGGRYGYGEHNLKTALATEMQQLVQDA